ncbi:MAG: ScyD/ScyE family protein [Nocardioides sp.]
MKHKTTLALVAASLTAATLVGAPTAGAAPADSPSFDGVRGLDIGRSGKTVIAASDGTVYKIVRHGPKAGTSRAIAKVHKNFVAPAVAVADDKAVWILTAGGENGPEAGFGSLYLKRAGHHKRLVANISAYVAKHNRDPFDLENNDKDSNPYGVAALPGRGAGALVADAANNSIMRVSRSGKITPIARVKPRVVEMPAGFDDPQMPPAGTPMPAEAVVTSVAVGEDGSFYFSELRGFPATPGTSQIWRVGPGARNAVCRPDKPRKGACKRVADGLTSVVALDAGRGGSLYVAELSKMSWFAMEGQVPGSEVGAIIRIGHDRSVRRELSKGKVIMPGGVAVGPKGNVFSSGPIFGPGGFMRVG